MKYLPHLLLATATAFPLVFFAAPGAGGGSMARETQLGPHSAQKFTLVTHTGGARQTESDNPNEPKTIALVLTVEQKMNGHELEITARAAAHRDGPAGTLVSVEGLRVHVTQPSDFGTQPQTTGEARISKTFSAPGGKYKTVVAEASIASPRYSDATVGLTIPGSQ